MLRGRCRTCGVRIRAQYLINELEIAGLFLWFYIVFYIVRPSVPWWGMIGGPWWSYNGILATSPALLTWLFLFAGLVAMTVIDARTFTVPPRIAAALLTLALIAMPLQSMLPIRPRPWPGVPRTFQWWPAPLPDWAWIGAGLGGAAGLAISLVLLWRGVLRYSFADYDQYIAVPESERELSTDRVAPAEVFFLLPAVVAMMAVGFGLLHAAAAGGAVFAIAWVARRRGMRAWAAEDEPTGDNVLAPSYPHARREMRHEIAFVLPCVVLGIAGFLLLRDMSGTPPRMLQTFAACLAGYIAGGGLVWGVRILGTLGFGREAMGLGDVHILAAVGAVLGWKAAAWAFIIACFFGVAWHLLSMIVTRHGRRELPFGPHLALAAFSVVAARPVISDFLFMLLKGPEGWPPAAPHPWAP
jgi:prepilin signal peptidase PulO-like enzyme (type II secretory pathway)